MILLGVIGWPIDHSRSPAMHTAAITALGLDATYVPMAVRPEDLSAALAGLRALSFRGVNVTLPHKRALLELLDEVDEAAQAIGAVNTVVFERGRSIGSNTDAAGMIAALAEAGVTLTDARVVILGAGGAARAAAYGAVREDAFSVHVASRQAEQAAEVAATIIPYAGACHVSSGGLLSSASLLSAFESANVLIQATSATLSDGEVADAFASALPIDALPSDASVFDMVYAPRQTSVLRAADAHGLRCIEGLGMLLHQGARAFEIFTGESADIDAMRTALG